MNDCDGTIKTACSDNPFDTLCVDTYLVDAAGRLAFCRADRKKNVINHVAATFSQPLGCGPIRAETCRNNPNDPVCPDNNAGRVKHDDWLRGFDAPLAKSSEPLFQPEGRNHQFLELDSDAAGAYSAPHLNLNLNTAVFDDHPINGDGGMAWRFGGFQTVITLGLRPPQIWVHPWQKGQQQLRVKWHGQVRAIGTRHGRVDADLIVDVNFYRWVK